MISNLQMSSPNSGSHLPRGQYSPRSTGLDLSRLMLALLALVDAPVQKTLPSILPWLYQRRNMLKGRPRATPVTGGPTACGGHDKANITEQEIKVTNMWCAVQ